MFIQHQGNFRFQPEAVNINAIIDIIRLDECHVPKASSKRNDDNRKVRSRVWIQKDNRKNDEAIYRSQAKQALRNACANLDEDSIILPLKKCQTWSWRW